MRHGNRAARLVLAVVAVLLVALPLALSSCGNSFPYQGTLSGDWSGQLTILGRDVSIGGTLSITVDSKGAVSGTFTSTTEGARPATMSGEVNNSGDLTGSVTLTIGATDFISSWQGKMTASGSSLGMQGTWTSQHGSGTFSGTGTSSK